MHRKNLIQTMVYYLLDITFNEVPAEQKQSGNCGEYRKEYLKNIPARIRVDVGAGGCWKKDNGGEYHYK
jgi:hypothetical protein